MKNKERKTLLTYWTTRYVLTICVGLVVIGLFSSMWIRYNETQKRLDVMKYMAMDISEQIVAADGTVVIPPFLPRLLDNRQRFMGGFKPMVLILDQQRRVILHTSAATSANTSNRFLDDILPRLSPNWEQNQSVQEIQMRSGENVFFLTQKIENNGKTLGWVFLFSPKKEMSHSVEAMQQLCIMLIGLGVLGWIVIYYLTKKLSEPVKDVADAAKQILTGQYDIELKKDIKEKEIYELIQSFKDMADRLRQLEMMRTELLAGVTHELKTPVTSISGLLQAVKDEVVTGEVAQEFLEVCSKEIFRLQKMVEDLLDFNSFAVGDIKVTKQPQNLNHLVQEITHQWLIGQEENTLSLQTYIPEQEVWIDTDPLRIQQILYNLLNNAKQATGPNGIIQVTLLHQEGVLQISVQDNGIGIPEAEKANIFERFYRGEEKKHKVRGLGLGLPFSNMMAKALGGDLQLTESVREKTIFTLSLKK
ncbi:sensor histidine kinase [Brevibacillus laterosporus]|uniref:histidine kinase n=1 Tax=Brevibacillus laterosporus TaxID=1465 RepID=A0A502HMW8_BRELA|nr:HAMP domain-containing sensor histidine kinase [Brevibacillus laterosporus]QDX95733.1 sensor histidine kinase [Brevibacillus laterosporus]TPG71659.1 sensor histidine kinase [Brevibacillus laterosporus]TPG74782.1 sensor histidine kinase [Brevibacillus laterosporus]